ncbi:hypothetical protein ACFL9T_16250 [Thermodesulfobacteriota bacterium]
MTTTLDDATARWARTHTEEHNTSISRMLGKILHEKTRMEEDYRPAIQYYFSDPHQAKTGRLSFQVLQEYYMTVIFKLEPGLEPESARKDVYLFFAW